MSYSYHIYVENLQKLKKDPMIAPFYLENYVFNNIKIKSNQNQELNQVDEHLKIPCFYKSITRNNEKRLSSFQEIYFLSYLNLLHPCIIQLYGWNENCILLEYAKYGSLYNVIHSNQSNINLDGTQKTKIAIGIAHAVNFLHFYNIIHYNLSSNNIVLNHKLEPKLIDFKNTKFIREECKIVGTPSYIAPEILNASENPTCTKKSDVYAFGMILWELATGNPPPLDQMPTLSNIRIELNMDGINEGLQFLINTCRQEHPKMRFDFPQIIKLMLSGFSVFEGTNMDDVIEYYKNIERNTIYNFSQKY